MVLQYIVSPRKIESPISIFIAAPDATDSAAMSPRPRRDALLTVAVNRVSGSPRTVTLTICSIVTRCSRRCSISNVSDENGKALPSNQPGTGAIRLPQSFRGSAYLARPAAPNEQCVAQPVEVPH